VITLPQLGLPPS